MGLPIKVDLQNLLGVLSFCVAKIRAIMVRVFPKPYERHQTQYLHPEEGEAYHSIANQSTFPQNWGGLLRTLGRH